MHDEDTQEGTVPSEFEDSLLEALARSSPRHHVPLPGERLGGPEGHRFEILERLGRGGMGQVFRAWDEQLHRTVALKFLPPRREAPELLLREARAIARLDHENIIRIHDVSEWSSSPWEPSIPFLIMECLEGEPLSSLLKRERLELLRGVEIATAVAAGLAHAHAHHLIHRDLKPSNVFLTRKGQVKLLDFGLAHLTAAAHPLDQPTAGTPLYMAPEQWRGERQDERTDVWAAGMLLFTLLTGKLPYTASSRQELRALVLSAQPVPSARERNPGLPEEVERLLAEALAKDPSQRLPSGAALHERLRRLEERLGTWREGPRRLMPERRQVTLLVCRLAGLEELADGLDPEDLCEVESAFHRLCSRLVLQHEGLATLSLADEVLACFGYPQAREEDSERAVHAALRLAQGLVPALRQECPGLPLHGLAAQVGLHTASVVFDDLLPELRGRALAIQGEAPRVAAALARQAGPGAVLLSPTTLSLVQGAFEVDETRRVARARRAALRFDRTRAARGLTPLVGRGRELQQLQEHWERARQGQGACVLIEGEAGIGKSRLLREWSARVPPEQGLVLRSQCWPQSQSSAFAPCIETLQSLYLLDPEAPPEHNLRWAHRRMDMRGLPAEHRRWLLSLLSLPVAEESPHLQLTPERRKEETLRALADLLERSAADSPLVWMLEDLHWADPSTLELIGFLLARLEHLPVLFLLSARPDFRPTWPRLSWRHRLTLERLAPEQTATLVRETAGERALPEETIQQLVERTDGIPLFIEELTRRVLESAPGSRAPIPATLHELLLARLDALPPSQKELVQLCAVVGRGFSHALLLRLAQRSESTLRRDLDGLLEAGLLQPWEEATGPGYQFRHALFQEAALHSQLRGTRRRHHQRIAQVLAEHFPEVAAQRPEVLAWHYTEAGDPKPALCLWARAGSLALRRSANQEAINHFQQALRILHTLPDQPRRRYEEMRLLFSLGIPLMQSQGFASPELERTYTHARDLFLELMGGPGQPELPDWSWGPYSYFFAHAQFSSAHELSQRVVEVGRQQHNREVLALGYRMMATDLFTLGHMTEALEHVEHALACSEFSLEQHRALAVRHWVNPRAVVLAYGSVVHSALGNPEQARRFSQEAVALAREIAHPHTLAYVLNYVAYGCQFRRDEPGALAHAEECIALSEEHHFLLWRAWSQITRSWALARLGRPGGSPEQFRAQLQQWQAAGLRAGLPVGYGTLAELHLLAGEQHQQAEEAAREGLRWARKTGERSYEAELYRLLGEALRRSGEEGEARRCFLQSLAVARGQCASTFELRATVSLCLQLQARGKQGAARWRLARLCGRFEPRLDSADLREARALLGQLPLAKGAGE